VIVDRAVELSEFEKEQLLTSVPGVGKTIARTLVAEPPELGTLDRRKIAALVGLRRGRASQGNGGEKALSAAVEKACAAPYSSELWFAARHNPLLKLFRDKLVAAGKPKLLALIAVARKVVTILNAILQDKLPWQPIPA
jgi:transposase